MPIPMHTALYITADEVVTNLTRLIMQGIGFAFAAGLEKKTGALFSTIAIQQLVNEELLHDRFEIATANHHALYTSSSGEQQLALLQHILKSQPDYIIVDNIFDSLDINNQQKITEALTGISNQTTIIQILYRKNDCLPFIKNVLTIKNGKLIATQPIDIFLPSTNTSKLFDGNIPPAINNISIDSIELVRMENVSVQYNEKQILHNICWQVNRGEFWQLKGPNGSGKSTILSMIIGDNVKGYGQNLYLFGNKKGSGETVWDIKKNIGYFTPSLTQNFPRLDSLENMIISGFNDSIGLYVQPTTMQIKLASQWLSLLGLSALKHQPFCFLTPVQQRMVLIARAMVKHPPLLILDEPTSGLDDENALLFIALVNKIAVETNTAIIFVSHRNEPGLQPTRVFELFPSKQGSIGEVVK